MNHRDIASKIEELERKKLATEAQMRSLSADLETVNKELEGLESQARLLGDDKRVLGEIVVACNYNSWQKVKDGYGGQVFFIEDERGGYVTFSLEDAKGLAKYLEDKIDYLESED